MAYTDYTADNKAVQALVAGGASRVRSSGAAVIPVSSGTITFGLSVLSRSDSAAAVVRVFDTGDTDESAAILIRTDAVSIVDQGEAIEATDLTGFTQGDTIRYTWEIILSAPVGDWALEISTNGTTAAVPIDFSEFSLVAPGVTGGSMTGAEIEAALDDELGSDAWKQPPGTFTGDADDIDDGATNVMMLATERSKLSAVEALADVTDAANVNAAGAVMESDYNANTILIATADNTPLPVTIGASTIVGRAAAGDIVALTAAQARTILAVEENADVTDAANVNTGGAVMESDYNANTILAATADNTPLPLTVGASTIVGRASTGDIVALTAAQSRTILNVEDGADVTDAANVNTAGAVMESDYDANTILAATADNTPVTLTVGEQTLVGRITAGNIAALTPAQSLTLLGLDDALTYDDAMWDVGTTYPPNTLVKKTGGDTIYLQADGADSTGDDPALGTPWEVFSDAAATASTDPSTSWWIRDMMVSTATAGHTASALASGTVATGDGVAGSVIGVNVISSTTATNSGYRYITTFTAMGATNDLISQIVFMIPTTVTAKSVRLGFSDSNSNTAGTDGVYVEVVDGTASVYARAGGAGSADATTGTVVADTWYRCTIHWTSTTTASVRIRTLDGVTTILSVDLASGLPSGTQLFGHTLVAWLNSGASAIALCHVDDLAYGIIPGYDIDA